MNPRLAALILGCFAASALHADLTTIPNSVKYRDTSIPNAKGRSGNATIEAQALLGKDGATELVVSAGAPGAIDKVQLKVAGANARNYSNLGGAVFTQTLGGLFRHQPLQVQANVGGVDGQRNDVVAATETVKLRPDLAVDSISLPPHTAIGMPTQINAIVRERNGDVGARANCVLRANGADVDRANGIWVDANGTVTCQFTHTFEAAGIQNVEVALTGVAPGDYDLANNAASKPIHVYETVTELPDWWATANDEVQHRTMHSSSPMQDSSSVYDTNITIVQFDGIIRNVSREQWSTMRVSYSETHDGNTTVDILDAPWAGRIRNSCAVAKIGSVQVEKCWSTPRHSPDTQPILHITAFHGGGEVTYHSQGWYYALNMDTGEYDRYTTNDDDQTNYGPRFTIGNSVAIRMQASDGNSLFVEANPFMNVAPFESHINDPETCSTGWDGGQYCWAYAEDIVARQAFVTSN